MPNWVYNGLTIEGNPEEINKLVAQMNKPYTQVHDNWNMQTQQMEKKLYTYPNPVFAFHNIYNHTEDNVPDEIYVSQPVHTPNQSYEDMFSGNDWYSWNVRNWGTKWDVAVHSDKEYSDTNVEGPVPNGENAVVHYNFNTAWSPPFPAIAKLSAQYPSLLFTHSYEEETGWGGECEFLRGEQLDGSEYGWKCRECDIEEDETPYCEECGFDTCPSCGYNESDEPCNEHKEKVNG
jgi:Ferredoxin-like domain in Api92-like protein